MFGYLRYLTGDVIVTRSFLPTVSAVSAVAAAALLLTGCGGGSGGSDKIDQSDATTTSAAAPTTTASATPSDTVKRPSTALPKDLTMTFDWPKTGDATKDAVLNDAEQYIRGYNRAAAAHNLKDPAYQFYSRDQGLTYAQAQIKANISGNWAPMGDDRYYGDKLKVVSSGSVTLSYCRNQTKAYSKNFTSGKVNITTPSDSDYVLYNVLFTKDAVSNGVWQASHVVVVERATQCKQ